MLLESIRTTTIYCKYCRHPLPSQANVKKEYHQECHKAVKNYKYVYDKYGLNREKFLPPEQVQFVEDLERYVRDFNPKLLMKNRLPILDSRTAPFYYNMNSDQQILTLGHSGQGLDHLFFENLPINHLPDSLKNVTSLEGIGIVDCDLDEFPEEICSIKDLKILNIRQSIISKIPSNIGNLLNLQVLGIISTNLEFLPDSIGNLTNLDKLLLFDNGLTSLPITVQKLSNLSELNIEDNLIFPIPKFLHDMAQLEYFEHDWKLLYKI